MASNHGDAALNFFPQDDEDIALVSSPSTRQAEAAIAAARNATPRQPVAADLVPASPVASSARRTPAQRRRRNASGCRYVACFEAQERRWTGWIERHETQQALETYAAACVYNAFRAHIVSDLRLQLRASPWHCIRYLERLTTDDDGRGYFCGYRNDDCPMDKLQLLVSVKIQHEIDRLTRKRIFVLDPDCFTAQRADGLLTFWTQHILERANLTRVPTLSEINDWEPTHRSPGQLERQLEEEARADRQGPR